MCAPSIASSESVVREEGRDALLAALQVNGAERAAFVFVFVADIRVSVFFREKNSDYSDVNHRRQRYPQLSRPVVGPRLDVCAFAD